MSDRSNEDKMTDVVTGLARTPVYRVLLLANLIGQPFFGRFGKHYDMTLNEWRTMLVVSQNPGISISGICHKSGLHIMNVSRGVKGLERRGRVMKKTDPDDRRRTVLELTEEGQAVFLDIAPEGLKWADEVFAALDEKETILFNSLLTKLIDKIHAREKDVS